MIVGGRCIDGVAICDLGDDRQELVSHGLKSREQRWAEGEKYMELVSFEISGIREVRFLIEASDMGQSNGACLVELLPQINCDPFLFGSATIYVFVSISLKIYD